MHPALGFCSRTHAPIDWRRGVSGCPLRWELSGGSCGTFCCQMFDLLGVLPWPLHRAALQHHRGTRLVVLLTAHPPVERISSKNHAAPTTSLPPTGFPPMRSDSRVFDVTAFARATRRLARQAVSRPPGRPHHIPSVTVGWPRCCFGRTPCTCRSTATARSATSEA